MSDLYGDQVALHYLPLLADLDNVRRYSWGSAILAFEHWAGPKHFQEAPRGALVLFRDQLERMVHGDFSFRPYEEKFMERLHPICLESREL
ncbi:hypothetical protein QQ045_022401 [Rhodiola kirilowii]